MELSAAQEKKQDRVKMPWQYRSLMLGFAGTLLCAGLASNEGRGLDHLKTAPPGIIGYAQQLDLAARACGEAFADVHERDQAGYSVTCSGMRALEQSVRASPAYAEQRPLYDAALSMKDRRKASWELGMVGSSLIGLAGIFFIYRDQTRRIRSAIAQTGNTIRERQEREIGMLEERATQAQRLMERITGGIDQPDAPDNSAKGESEQLQERPDSRR